MLRWGATSPELALALPGDDVLPEAGLVATRAITIRATPGEVWPWIAQIGQGRGGFYSYDVLENLVGADIHNADRIVAEWQDLEVGDEVRLAPEVALTVAQLDRGRSLVLQGGVGPGPASMPYAFTWSFVVLEQASGNTRLVVRERYAFLTRWAPLLVQPVAMISSVMTRRMLRGITERAERAARTTFSQRPAA
jgi:hypothetical protein